MPNDGGSRYRVTVGQSASASSDRWEYALAKLGARNPRNLISALFPRAGLYIRYGNLPVKGEEPMVNTTR